MKVVKLDLHVLNLFKHQKERMKTERQTRRKTLNLAFRSAANIYTKLHYQLTFIAIIN